MLLPSLISSLLATDSSSASLTFASDSVREREHTQRERIEEKEEEEEENEESVEKGSAKLESSSFSSSVDGWLSVLDK